MSQSQNPIESLIDEIAAKLTASDQHLIIRLREELARQQQANRPGDKSGTATATLDKASGCYLFSNDPGFYCPRCFDRLQQKVATQRLNRKLRVCPQCRSSLRPAE